MTYPAIELQRAVFAALSLDTGLTAVLGGPRVYDHAPPDVAFPYVTFSRVSAYDWSTATEDGAEHVFTIHVWSKARGKSQTHELLGRIRARLHDAPLALSGHALVNLRAEFAEVRFDEDLSLHHGLLRLRAVTEPAAG